MATNKPKVQGYLEQCSFDALEAYRLENNLSLSQALDIVVASFFKLNQDAPDLKNVHLKKLAELEESIEAINKVFRISFEAAFKRIAKLEQSDSLEITSDTPGDRLIICKLYKNNADDSNQWRFWAGLNQGFIGDLKMARKYKNESAVKRQINIIEESNHAATSRERISWKPQSELQRVLVN